MSCRNESSRRYLSQLITAVHTLVTRHAARHALTKLQRGDQLDDLCTAQIWFGRTGNALDFGRSVSDLCILRDLACAGAAARDAYHIRRLATGEQERRQYEGEERGHVDVLENCIDQLKTRYYATPAT
jgi:hypothetical protein